MAHWIRLVSFPYFKLEHSSDPICINDNQLLLVGDTSYKTSADGIFAYFINKDKWCKLIKYPIELQDSNYAPKSVFDAETNALYIYNNNNNIIEISLNNIDNIKWNVTNSSIDFGSNTTFISVKDELHFVGGSNNNKHYVWNKYNHKLKEMHQFIEFKELIDHKLLSIKSQQILLLFTSSSLTRNMSIYSFSLLTNKWIDLNINCDILEDKLINHIVVSRDGVHILIFTQNASFNEEVADQCKIYIFNLKTKVIRYSNTETPIDGEFKAVLIDKEVSPLLTYGYIRSVQNIILPPLEIIDLINSMIINEFLHIINIKNSNWTGGQHWKCHITDILR